MYTKEARCEWRGGAPPARARHIRQGRSYRAPTRQLQNAVAKFVMTLVQAPTERPTCASCECATVGSVSLLSFACYWLVLLMRRLALAAVGKEARAAVAASRQMCCLRGRAAITVCCQLQLVPHLIALPSLLVVSCSSSKKRSCVCCPPLSCRRPTPPSQHHHRCSVPCGPLRSSRLHNSQD